MITKEQRVKLVKELGELIQDKKELIEAIKSEVEELRIIRAGLQVDDEEC